MVVSGLWHLRKYEKGRLSLMSIYSAVACFPLTKLILTLRLKAKGEDPTQGKLKEKAFIVKFANTV